MANETETLRQLQSELKACIAASETQLSLMSAKPDVGFGMIAAEVAAMVRNQRRLAEIEDRLARVSSQIQYQMAA